MSQPSGTCLSGDTSQWKDAVMRVIIELNQEEQAGTAIQVIPAASPAVVPASATRASTNGHAAVPMTQGESLVLVDDEPTDAGPPPAALLRAVEEGMPMSLLTAAGSARTNGHATPNGSAGHS